MQENTNMQVKFVKLKVLVEQIHNDFVFKIKKAP